MTAHTKGLALPYCWYCERNGNATLPLGTCGLHASAPGIVAACEQVLSLITPPPGRTFSQAKMDARWWQNFAAPKIERLLRSALSLPRATKGGA